MLYKGIHISLRLKKLGFTIINSVVAGLIFLYKIVRPLFIIFGKIIKFFYRFIFRFGILPTYKIYLRLKNFRRQKQVEQANVFHLFSSRTTVHVLIVLVGGMLFLNNLQTKSTLAEELGRGSMIFELAKTDEFAEIKDEAILILPEENNNKEKTPKPEEKKETGTTTAGSVFDTAVGRRIPEISGEESLENALAANNTSINLGVLLRTSSPSTQTTIPERKEIIAYTVSGGETVASIAKKFGVSVNTILWENKLGSASLIKPGQILMILPTSGISYLVGKNETLATIAKKYKLDVEDLIGANRLASADEIRAGQKIVIPGGRPASSVAPKTSSSVANVFTKNTGSLGTAAKNSGGLIWPTVSKRITQYFTWRHTGLDVGTPVGQPIYAASDGVVEIATGGWNGGYGTTILINHGGGKKTRYGHLSKIYVVKGQEVRQGETIGASGNTGRSTGPHLHFEYLINGSRVNPLSYF